MPESWDPGPVDEPSPGPGLGFALLLVVVGVLLLLLAWGAVWIVLDVVTSLTGMP